MATYIGNNTSENLHSVTLFGFASTTQADAIYGMGGDDNIYSIGGMDSLFGGEGNDTIHYQ
jgi:Ca2+-binding RTX toxin-like protein